jgi:hypothetical protein
MDALLLAKRRHRRLRREGGAAMFVVSMAIITLATVGMYALAAAQNEVRTSGNERQSTQTHYLSEYGVIGITHELVASKADFYVKLMQNPQSQDWPCVSLPGAPAPGSTSANGQITNGITTACRRVYSSELGTFWAAPVTNAYTGTVPFTPNTVPGSLGPAPMTADFFVELTDPNETTAPPRYSSDNHFCFVQLTATSTGITQPFFPSGANPTAQFGAEGLEMQRARILAGPIPCPR